MAERLNIKNVAISTIKPYEYNARRNKKAIKAVAESIKQFGFINPIVVDKDNVIVAGHTRYSAAQLLELDTVPVIVADDLSDEEIRAFRLADNRVAEIATWDKKKLQMELSTIDEDMTVFGFKADDDVLKKEISQCNHHCPKCGYEW